MDHRGLSGSSPGHRERVLSISRIPAHRFPSLFVVYAGKWAAGAYVLALLYRVNEGSFFPRSVRAWWAELLEERSERQAKLAASDEKARKKGGEDPNARRPA